MTLYIALLDTDPADSRQFERQLSREADKRKYDGELLYTESFGSREAMLRTPMKYDFFIVSIKASDNAQVLSENLALAKDIRDCNIHAPIALFYPEDMPLPAKTSLDENVTHHNKYATQAYISRLCGQALAFKAAQEQRFEVRGEGITYFVTAQELIYASKNGNDATVYMSEGRCATLYGTGNLFFEEISEHEDFLKISSSCIVNLKHVIFHKGLMLSLTNGSSCKMSPTGLLKYLIRSR